MVSTHEFLRKFLQNRTYFIESGVRVAGHDSDPTDSVFFRDIKILTLQLLRVASRLQRLHAR